MGIDKLILTGGQGFHGRIKDYSIDQNYSSHKDQWSLIGSKRSVALAFLKKKKSSITA
jgi:ribosomal protein L3